MQSPPVKSALHSRPTAPPISPLLVCPCATTPLCVTSAAAPLLPLPLLPPPLASIPLPQSLPAQHPLDYCPEHSPHPINIPPSPPNILPSPQTTAPAFRATAAVQFPIWAAHSTPLTSTLPARSATFARPPPPPCQRPFPHPPGPLPQLQRLSCHAQSHPYHFPRFPQPHPRLPRHREHRSHPPQRPLPHHPIHFPLPLRHARAAQVSGRRWVKDR